MAITGVTQGQQQGEEASTGLLGRELTSIRFAAVARQLSEVSRQLGLEAPGFRSPPRSPGARRSIRREADGSATISVALRGRVAVAVIGDMIDGVLVAAGLSEIEAGAARDALWSAAASLLDDEIEVGSTQPARLAA